MNKKILVDSIGIAFLALVVVVGYKLSPLLMPKIDLSVQPDPACDLHREPCTTALPGGGSVRVSIAPRPIPMVAPLTMEVVVSGRDAGRVEIDFAGVDMNMGYNRPELAAQGGGRFTGGGSLPICVTGTMDWRATVLIESGRERIAVPYVIASKQP